MSDLTLEQQRTIADAARILEERRDPRTPEQVKAAAEAAEYAERMAASDAAFLNDAAAQAGAAAASREAERKRKQEIEYRKAAARSDSRAAAIERFELSHVHAGRQCMECRTPVYEGKEPAPGHTLCMTCWGRRALTCDECGRKGDLTRWCNDHLWRCDTCAAAFLERPFDPKAGSKIFFPTMAASR